MNASVIKKDESRFVLYLPTEDTSLIFESSTRNYFILSRQSLFVLVVSHLLLTQTICNFLNEKKSLKKKKEKKKKKKTQQKQLSKTNEKEKKIFQQTISQTSHFLVFFVLTVCGGFLFYFILFYLSILFIFIYLSIYLFLGFYYVVAVSFRIRMKCLHMSFVYGVQSFVRHSQREWNSIQSWFFLSRFRPKIFEQDSFFPPQSFLKSTQNVTARSSPGIHE